MTLNAPELLAPAGSLAMLKTAFAFGADAVYAGQPRYSLRVRNNDFGRIETLREGIECARALGRRFYLVSNIFPHDVKIKSYVQNMAPVVALRPDAMIMSDPGLMMLVREAWPEMEIHLSVQANTVNSASVRFWRSVGIRRVILSRELSLEQVAQIRQECPDTELEVFVHGALCIAYSGRCLLSGYFNHRDANQGSCTNSCRWDYKVHAGVSDASGDIVAPASAFVLEEGQRPGAYLPIEEDEHGTYVLNSKDLRTIEHVRRLVEIGVDSLKIEGRTKSPYYVARTTQAYRQAIDDASAGRDFDPALLGQLEGLANRGYTSGFFQRHTPEETQNYLRGYSQSGRSLYVGDVVAYDASRQLAEVNVRNRFGLGDWLEIIHPQGNGDLHLDRMENSEAQAIALAPGSGHRVWLPLPESAVGAFVARYPPRTVAAAHAMLTVDPKEVEITAIRAQGAGGQNVNKVSSAIQLRFDIAASSLPDEVKRRLLARKDSRLTKTGVLVIKAQQHRTQDLNRSDALARLNALVHSATPAPKMRRATLPTAASRQRRRLAKTLRAQTKALRAAVGSE